LQEGGEVTLVTRDLVGETPEAIPVQNEDLPQMVAPGDQILLDDGTMELRVLSTTEDEVQARVRVGGVLKSNKGINLPGIAAELPSITEKDRWDLTHALQWEIDWIALSFVRTADDIRKLKALIHDLAPDREPPPVMAKIEKPQALDNIEAIIEAADAVMVARGDLGIEIPPQKVPMAQKRIIAACNEKGVPVVTATQMLDSMIRNPRPTRAEASDVANAILDGTDAVMLSGETAIGAYPVESVRTMMHIIREVEAQRPISAVGRVSAREEDINRSIADAVGRAARQAARDLQAAAVVTPTASGHTARIMSRYRPRSPIVAVTPNPRVQRRLMLYWGVTPLQAPRTDDTDEMIDRAVAAAREAGFVRAGDTVIITAGAASSEPGTTNLMRVYVVE
ncbi:MAG: pyruvate kinase, partial [Chloroflexota bacterium]|nr:pyruvate kinase [Chloroflexota bacterium]